MKADKYTKTVLTIIAICLINLSLGDLNFFHQAQASSLNTPEIRYGMVPLNPDGSITVRLSNLDEIDVNIKNISTSDELKVDIAEISTSDELDINIDELGGGFVSVNGPLPVEVK